MLTFSNWSCYLALPQSMEFKELKGMSNKLGILY
jgi:hypothetical protein